MITAIEAKQKADNRNDEIHLGELKQILKAIENESTKGNYSFSNSGSVSLKTIDKIKELGYNFETGGRMNEIEYVISWAKAVEPALITIVKPKLFYSDEGIIKLATDKKPFVEDLIKRYDNVCWGGAKSKHWSTSSFDDVVVVFEAGIRGPADWFFVNDKDRWVHGGYTAYKETYSDIEFEDMIKTTWEGNKKYK
jgi:lipopolysaccharide biosynthesis glycosyltransferase